MKGYWLIFATDVVDADAHVEYNELWAPIAKTYEVQIKKPKVPFDLREERDTARVLLVEFPTYAAAQACYDDPAYQEALIFAKKASHRDLVIFEGNVP